jgi:hypothetical protein
MKGCLICFHEADVSVASCPKCGEASWTQPFPKVGSTVRIERPAFAVEAEPAVSVEPKPVAKKLPRR